MNLESALKKWEKKLREQGYSEEFREGFLEGFREGFRKGMQTLLLDTLRYQFGPVPRAVRERVREMSSFAEFKKLLRTVMKANSLQETGLLEPKQPGKARSKSRRPVSSPQ